MTTTNHTMRVIHMSITDSQDSWIDTRIEVMPRNSPMPLRRRINPVVEVLAESSISPPRRPRRSSPLVYDHQDSQDSGIFDIPDTKKARVSKVKITLPQCFICFEHLEEGCTAWQCDNCHAYMHRDCLTELLLHKNDSMYSKDPSVHISQAAMCVCNLRLSLK